MSLDPAAEYERVREKYPPLRPFEVALFVLVVAALAIVGQFREADWLSYALVLAGAAGWELTKLRLRRNARRFADASR